MSDPGPSPHDDELRRLLRDAREREPMPSDVVARLDGVLDQLRQEEPPAPPPADLAAARRRRTRLRNALVAAAAVVVVGYGVSQVDLSSGGDDAGSASRSMTSDDEAAGGSAADAAPLPLDLDAEGFDDQVRRSGVALEERRNSALAGPAAPTTCDDPAWGAGVRLPATYDGEAAVLVYRPARGGAQRVVLFLCGESEPTRSTTVPAP